MIIELIFDVFKLEIVFYYIAVVIEYRKRIN